MLLLIAVVAFVALFVLIYLFAAESRPEMGRIDVSAALPDDGAWLQLR